MPDGLGHLCFSKSFTGIEETDTESKERNAIEKSDESLLHNQQETLDNAKETAKSSDDIIKLQTETENRENDLKWKDDNSSGKSNINLLFHLHIFNYL